MISSVLVPVLVACGHSALDSIFWGTLVNYRHMSYGRACGCVLRSCRFPTHFARIMGIARITRIARIARIARIGRSVSGSPLMLPYQGFGNSDQKMNSKFHRFRCCGNKEPSGPLSTSPGGPTGLQGLSCGAQRVHVRAGSHLISINRLLITRKAAGTRIQLPWF